MGLALFTEATGALSMEWKCRALSQLGLRSLGRKVNSESLWTSGDQPEKRKRERENDTERPSSDEARSAALFSKGAFIPWVEYLQKWKMQSQAESVQHYVSFIFIGTRMFSEYLSIWLIMLFSAKDGEALYSQQKQDQELTVAQIMSSLLPNSNLNWRK